MPVGGDRLLAIRLAGQDPAELIMVSLVGQCPDYADNYTLYAKPGQKYDWRLIKGLEVCLLIKPGLTGLERTLLDMAMTIRPGKLYVWDVVHHAGSDLYAFPDPDTIDKPQHLWRWFLDALPWLPRENVDFLKPKCSYPAAPFF